MTDYDEDKRNDEPTLAVPGQGWMVRWWDEKDPTSYWDEPVVCWQYDREEGWRALITDCEGYVDGFAHVSGVRHVWHPDGVPAPTDGTQLVADHLAARQGLQRAQQHFRAVRHLQNDHARCLHNECPTARDRYAAGADRRAAERVARHVRGDHLECESGCEAIAEAIKSFEAFVTSRAKPAAV